MSEKQSAVTHAFRVVADFRGDNQPSTSELIELVEEFVKEKSKENGWDFDTIGGVVSCCDEGIANSSRWEIIMAECEHYLDHLRHMDKQLPIGNGSEGLNMFEKAIAWLKGYGNIASDLVEQSSKAVRAFVEKLKMVSNMPLDEQLKRIPTELLRDLAAKKGHPNPGLESHAALIDWMMEKVEESTQVN